MKKALNSLLALVIVSTVFCALAIPSFAERNNASLSKRELKALLANAKSPAEHRTIAAYYQQKANELTAKSQQHLAMAGQFLKQPSTIESKQGTGASHCLRFAERYASEARESASQASAHEAMAAAEGN